VVRTYNPETDAGQAFALLGKLGDVDLTAHNDLLVVDANQEGISGLLAARPIAFIHELAIRPGMKQRAVADRLAAYALGVGKNLGIREAMFLVSAENQAMLGFAESLGAKEEKAGRIFTLPIL
jgi:ribosomal protein S18 acetylase RimI-like enzyme